MRLTPFLILLALTAAPALADHDGKQVFLDAGCNLCHTVPGADIEAKTKSDKMKGPDLGVEALPPMETLEPYLRQKSELDGKKHKKAFKGSKEELAAMAAWLDALHQANSSGSR